MAVLQNSVSIPATSVNANVIAGSIWETPDRNYYGRLACTGSATGLVLTVQAGQVTQLEESPISTANRFPILPDDLIISRFPIPRFRRLILKVRNTTAGALTFFFNLHLDPA